MPSPIRHIRFLWIVSIGILGLASCHSTDDSVVARVYDHTLYVSDLQSVVPQGVSASDSITLVRNYINQWVEQMIMVSKAEKNIKADFSREMQLYHNSLLVYSYEQQIIKQNLDTIVPNSEIASYYNEHLDDFVLLTPAVKILYVKLRPDDANLYEIEHLMQYRELNESSMLRLTELCAKNPIEMSLEAEDWVYLNDIQDKLPPQAIADARYLSYNRFARCDDSTGVSLVRFVASRMTDEYAPVEMVRDNIKTIILNRRKQEIVNKMRLDLRRKAEADGAVTIID